MEVTYGHESFTKAYLKLLEEFLYIVHIFEKYYLQASFAYALPGNWFVPYPCFMYGPEGRDHYGEVKMNQWEQANGRWIHMNKFWIGSFN